MIVITITPTNCRVAFKALNQGFKRWVFSNTFRLFLKREEPAHQYQGELPFFYALGQRLCTITRIAGGICYFIPSNNYLFDFLVYFVQ